MIDKEFKGVLVFAEQKNNNIHKITYELLGKGRLLANKLQCELYTVILGPNNIDLLELIYRGSDKIYHIVDDEIFNKPR